MNKIIFLGKRSPKKLKERVLQGLGLQDLLIEEDPEPVLLQEIEADSLSPQRVGEQIIYLLSNFTNEVIVREVVEEGPPVT